LSGQLGRSGSEEAFKAARRAGVADNATQKEENKGAALPPPCWLFLPPRAWTLKKIRIDVPGYKRGGSGGNGGADKNGVRRRPPADDRH